MIGNKEQIVKIVSESAYDAEEVVLLSVWNTGDLISALEMMGDDDSKPSKEQIIKDAADIMELIEDDMDANVGINWDYIIHCIEKYYNI